MSHEWAPRKPNFGPPPPGYVPGLGRAATGFITRSDIGPAKIPQVKNMTSTPQDEGNYNDAKYDDWEGYKGPIFSKDNLSKEDKEAEEAYDFCERRLLDKKEEGEKKLLGKLQVKQQNEDASINNKFKDLKRDLSSISYEEWQTIPDCIDLSVKKRKRQRFTPVPDALIMNALSNEGTSNSIEQEGHSFRQAKETLLKSKLNDAENKMSGKNDFDKVGYMTQLNTKIDGEFVGDVKRARLLLKAALSSNPFNSDVWLAAARVEELDGKLEQCRVVLRDAVVKCPTSEALWLELSRIEKEDIGKNVLIEGLRHLPASQKLWLYATRKEQDPQQKSKILRKGLENCPSSIRLWRELIELQSEEQAKNLLYKAVQSLPKQIELWLALAKIEDYKNATKLLNRARKANPLNMSIWINAAKLEETESLIHPNPKIKDKISSILGKARDILKKNGANITREEWLQEAILAERADSLLTCQCLVATFINQGISEEEFPNVLRKDLRSFEVDYGSFCTTRFLFRYGILKTKSRQLMWDMIEFENRIKLIDEGGSQCQIADTLKLAVTVFQDSPEFWTTMGKRLLNEGKTAQAEQLVDNALQKISSQKQKEELLLFKVQIYQKSDHQEKARSLLEQIVERNPKSEALLTFVVFQYDHQNFKKAWQLCEHYFKTNKAEDYFKVKKSEQFWVVACKIKQKLASYSEALPIVQKALASYPQCLPLWKFAIEFEIASNHISKARAVIQKAQQKISCEELALISIQLQLKVGSKKEASFAVSKSLKKFNKSAHIWTYAIELENPSNRKKVATNAIQACGQHALLSNVIAKLFWKEGKLDKAKKWFEEALKLSLFNGDVWAYYIQFISASSQNSEEVLSVITKFKDLEEEVSGRKWNYAKQRLGSRKARMQILEQIRKEIKEEMKLKFD